MMILFFRSEKVVPPISHADSRILIANVGIMKSRRLARPDEKVGYNEREESMFEINHREIQETPVKNTEIGKSDLCVRCVYFSGFYRRCRCYHRQHWAQVIGLTVANLNSAR